MAVRQIVVLRRLADGDPDSGDPRPRPRGVPAPVAVVGLLAVVALAFLAGAVLTGGNGDDETGGPPATEEPDPAEPVLEEPPEPVEPVEAVEPAPPEGTFFVTAGEGAGTDLGALADAIRQRLRAAGHAAALAEVDDGRVRVDPGGGPLAVPAMQSLLREPGRLEIRAVRRERPPERCADAAPVAQGADDDSLYPEYELRGQRSGLVVACYVLAPGGVTNAAVEDATVTVVDPDGDGDRSDDYGVDLVLSAGGIDAFNELAAACRPRAAPCDAGLAAIALDQVVLMAPRVRDTGFDRFDIQISGDVDEEEANSLVAALTTAPLPRGLEFSD